MNSAIGLLLLCHLLLATAMAASPELHEFLHHHHRDASHHPGHPDDGDNDCVVYHMQRGDFADGAGLAPATLLTAPLVYSGVAYDLPESAWVRPLYLTDSRLVRGPPARG